MKRKLLLLLLVLLTNVSVVYCDSKEVEVNLDKAYSDGTFNILYNSLISDCVGYLISPMGDRYDCTVQENGYMYSRVENIESGKWKVQLTSESEIGEVTINLSANSEVISNEENKINIIRKITGISAYLENRTVKAEWTDTKCGDVLVIVSDSATKKTLDSNVVKNAYEYVVPNGYSSIDIMLVPSALASNEDAKTSYTFSMDSVPVIDIKHDIGTITNKDKVDVTITATEEYDYQAFINEKEVAASKNISFETEKGQNTIDIIAISKDGHRSTYKYSFIKDSEAPVLTFDNDFSGFSTNESSLIISGKVSGATKLLIGGKETVVSVDNSFAKEIQLADGINEVKIVAMDEAGNETMFIMNIEKKLHSSSSIIADVVFLAACVITIFFLVFKFGKKKKSDKNKNVNKKQSNKVEEKQKNEKPIIQNDISEKVASIKKQEEKKELVSEKKKKIDNSPNITYSRSKSKMFEYIIWAGSALLIILMTQFVMSIDIVQSNSMEPNIMTGELLFTNKVIDKNTVQRGDIVVFNVDGVSVCKRVVGEPGDEISFSQGYVVINGEYCKEEYLDENVETNSMKTFKVPDGCVFCLGDNREYSYDARYWENPYIQKNNIYGKVVLHIPFLNIFKKN